MRINNTSGFTLIEMMVVVAIVSVLSSVAVVNMGGTIGKAHDAKRLAHGRAIHQALIAFYTQYEELPGPAHLVGSAGQFVGDGDVIDDLLRPFFESGVVPRDPKHDGVTYYYAYDPAHMVTLENCGTGVPPSFIPAAVFSIHTFEATDPARLPRATCVGTNMNQHLSHYNVALPDLGAGS